MEQALKSSFTNKINRYKKLKPYDGESFSLIIGVICGSTIQIRPLLDDINNLRNLSFIINIEVIILANGENSSDVSKLLSEVFSSSNSPVFSVFSEEQEDLILPIGQARSKLQKIVGIRMDDSISTYAWILDDDMRIPKEANTYLTWLPAFKKNGVDVLIGNFNGSSPNPPAHGIRTQLNDLIHNLTWLNNLSDCSELPDRSYENELFRLEYPDYYYDLSRKHKTHLDKAYWITPKFKGETVKDARQRILENVDKILTGEPFLRPLITVISTDPLTDSYPSCNRGGNTFVLNSKALTLTPNAILLTNGEENRRSDMIWAIINSYYHNFKIHAVSFPVYHHRYVNISANFSLDKTISEIRGAALYAAMFNFFQQEPQPEWRLLQSNNKEISDLYYEYINTRLTIYKENFKVVSNLLDKIEFEHKEVNKVLDSCICKLRKWVSTENLEQITRMVDASNKTVDIEGFLKSINNQINSF